MKSNFSNKAAIFLVLAGLFAISLQGCRGGADLESTSTDPGGGSSGPTGDDLAPQAPDNSAGFNIKVDSSQSALSYVLHKGTGIISDNFSDECAVYNSSSSKDIMCIMEAKELDLYFSGAKLRYNVPSDMCQYFTYLAPYYYNYEPGTGPATRIDNSNGSTTNGGVAAGSILNNTCNYDHTASDGPNCCVGTYTNTVYSKATSGADTVATTTQSWGGSYSNCLDGPAMSVNKANTNGYPITTIMNVENVGTNDGYTISAPMDKLRAYNVFVANFFNTADHTGLTPLAYRAANGASPTNPYHIFTCYDRAHEVKARIRVMIREWNLVSEYELGVNGDPDSGGTEPVFGGNNNDIGDWKDLGASYPEDQ